MFKRKRLEVKFQFPVINGPLFGKVKKFPFAPALITAVVMSVMFFPSAIVLVSVPYYLRVGTDENIISPPLKFQIGRASCRERV